VRAPLTGHYRSRRPVRARCRLLSTTARIYGHFFNQSGEEGGCDGRERLVDALPRPASRQRENNMRRIDRWPTEEAALVSPIAGMESNGVLNPCRFHIFLYTLHVPFKVHRLLIYVGGEGGFFVVLQEVGDSLRSSDKDLGE
jgi:hypothetical protein